MMSFSLIAVIPSRLVIFTSVLAILFGTNSVAAINLVQESSDQQTAPEGVPEWFKSQDEKIGDVHYLMVTSKPAATMLEAERGIGPAAFEAVLRFAGRRLFQQPNQELAFKLGITESLVVDELLSPEFQHIGIVENSFTEEMKKRLGERHAKLYCAYVRVEITPEFLTSIDEKWDNDQTRQRVVSTGIVGGGLLCFLGVIFGYLRLNHATRGFYSRRLQMGAASVTILITLICYGLFAAFN